MSEMAVLMSIKPTWVNHILVLKDKKYEVRKRAPSLKTPFKVYVYCTCCLPILYHETKEYTGRLNGHVCGEFTCTCIHEMRPPWFDKTEGTQLTSKELAKYAQGEKLVYWEISNPILYDKPRNLIDFGAKGAPQSFQYAIELEKMWRMSNEST